MIQNRIGGNRDVAAARRDGSRGRARGESERA